MKPKGLFLLLLCCLGQGPAPAVAAATAARPDLQQLDNSIDSIRDDLKKAHQARQQLQEKLKHMDRQVDQLGRKQHQLAADMNRQEQTLAQHQQQHQTLQRQLDRHRQQLRNQIRVAYATGAGHQELIKILLNQENAAALGRVMAYYNYYNQARIRHISELTDKITALAQLESDIAENQTRLRELQRNYTQERGVLLASLQERGQVLEQLNSDIQSKDQRLAQLLDEKKQLENVLASLHNEAQDTLIASEVGKPFAYYKGRLDWPTRGSVIVRFGSPQVDRLKWQGIVIASEAGQEVHAVATGRVAFADWLPGYGMVIIVDHGKDYLSLYGYNRSLLRKTGDWVDAGEAIAIVGNSGSQASPGLYFEIRHQSKAQNPLLWLSNPPTRRARAE